MRITVDIDNADEREPTITTAVDRSSAAAALPVYEGGVALDATATFVSDAAGLTESAQLLGPLGAMVLDGGAAPVLDRDDTDDVTGGEEVEEVGHGGEHRSLHEPEAEVAGQPDPEATT
jgi:hypothetical protein